MWFGFLKRNKIRKSIIGFTLVLVVILSIVLNRKPKFNDDLHKEWHTKKYLAAALLEKNDLESISDPDLKNLLTRRPELPASWLKKIDYSEDKSCRVDKEGNKHCRATFYLVDGDIVWTYELGYGPDGALKYLLDSKCDAKEYNPEYEAIIQGVNQKVSEEMERKNIKGLGSCHTFWELKKKYLKAKGIEWKSPSELNPNTMYD
jgi:hypothetical protein